MPGSQRSNDSVAKVCTHVSKLHLRFKDYEPMPASIVNGHLSAPFGVFFSRKIRTVNLEGKRWSKWGRKIMEHQSIQLNIATGSLNPQSWDDYTPHMMLDMF